MKLLKSNRTNSFGFPPWEHYVNPSSATGIPSYCSTVIIICSSSWEQAIICYFLCQFTWNLLKIGRQPGYRERGGERVRAVPRKLGPAGSSLSAGFLWRNTAQLSLSDQWDSAAGPGPEHTAPGTNKHSQINTCINENTHKKVPLSQSLASSCATVESHCWFRPSTTCYLELWWPL